ncbi:lipopolysaccharide assembly protein LapA domain-containing protein [Aquabacter cavernae]|uniref:lipopolysaccharide assembly protein LapA domain-containing protein n=1 Tax=Aquabacter cavernae TaxID=2496029 RepID=UPI000F8F054F|nr:lipopolysaccharide assembly protein LapA domain-containing protein [Aquabacter cavernae]
MKRVLSVVIGLPLCVIVVALAVANRRAVPLSLDPFSPDTSALTVHVPLFVIIFVALILGVVAGGSVSWLGQGRFRREARRVRKIVPAPEASVRAPGLPAPVRRG